MKVNLAFCTFLLTAILGCSKHHNKNSPPPPPQNNVSAYDKAILSDSPAGFWLLDKDNLKDAGKLKLDGSWHGDKTAVQKLPDGEDEIVFNGSDSYYEIPDNDQLEITNKGELTIEAWMSPEVYDFPDVETDKDYIHWMGKGTAGQQSWAARMYNKDSWRENRPQRISGYVFNPEGELGAGSYFQDAINPGTWIYFVLVINTNEKSATYPGGYIKIYRDGKLRDQDDLGAYNIVSRNGTAPVRIGTRDFGSFFKGSIAKVAIYDYELPPSKIDAHFEAMK